MMVDLLVIHWGVSPQTPRVVFTIRNVCPESVMFAPKTWGILRLGERGWGWGWGSEINFFVPNAPEAIY